MPEHSHISERLERRTYIKGTFKGKFIGNLDRTKSDYRFERFFDLEIREGEIFTSLDNIKKWQEAQEPADLTDSVKFRIRPSVKILVTLRYFDSSLKYFKISLQEIKLVNCRLTNQVYDGSEVYGTIEGEISAYILHYDTLVKEVTEDLTEPVKETLKAPGTPTDPLPPAAIRTVKGTLIKWLKKSFSSEPHPRKNGCLLLISVFTGLSFLAGIFVISRHWSLLVLFLVLGVLLIPRFYNRLARKFNLRWSSKAVTVLCIVLFTIIMALLLGFYEKDQQETAQQKAFLDNDFAGKAEQIKSKQRKDSFDYHVSENRIHQSRNRVKQALEELDKASAFATSQQGGIIEKEKMAVHTLQADALYKDKQYKEAIPMYNDLLSISGNNPDLLYKRAMCNKTLGNMQEAVNDLKKAIELGDEPSRLLHDKINPVKKVLVGYTTLCRDGTTSSATGRGACSWHGGVQEWHHPVYEERRKYE